MKKETNTATTEYIAGQKGYGAIKEFGLPDLKVEVFNKKRNKWDKKEYHFEIVLHGKKRKTDEFIKVYYEKRRIKANT